MGALAGFKTSVYIGGTPVAMVAEPCTDIGSPAYTHWQPVDQSKVALNPEVQAVWTVDGTPTTPASVDYPTGTATFSPALSPTAVVTVDAEYVPLLKVATARAVEINGEGKELDSSVFDAAGWETFVYGPLGMSGSLGLVEDFLYDHDPGAGALTIADCILNNRIVLLGIMFDETSSSDGWALWAVLATGSVKTGFGDLVTGEVTFKLADTTYQKAPSRLGV